MADFQLTKYDSITRRTFQCAHSRRRLAAAEGSNSSLFGLQLSYMYSGTKTMVADGIVLLTCLQTEISLLPL